MSEAEDEPPDERAAEGFADRWALTALSVVMSIFAAFITMLMLGSLAADADWMAPLLSLVVLTFSVMGIGLAVAAVVLRKEGAWAAFGFAVLPCAVVIGTWASAIRHSR